MIQQNKHRWALLITVPTSCQEEIECRQVSQQDRCYGAPRETEKGKSDGMGKFSKDVKNASLWRQHWSWDLNARRKQPYENMQNSITDRGIRRKGDEEGKRVEKSRNRRKKVCLEPAEYWELYNEIKLDSKCCKTMKVLEYFCSGL